MESLADFLGVRNPQTPDVEPPKQNRRQLIGDFCRGVLESEEYRASLLRRIWLGELPPAIEALLYHYAHGKPVEKVEVRDTTVQIEELSAEQLEQRAMFLVECARQMRLNERQPLNDDSSPAVH